MAKRNFQYQSQVIRVIAIGGGFEFYKRPQSRSCYFRESCFKILLTSVPSTRAFLARPNYKNSYFLLVEYSKLSSNLQPVKPTLSTFTWGLVATAEIVAVSKGTVVGGPAASPGVFTL
jgi:hypothetical protein